MHPCRYTFDHSTSVAAPLAEVADVLLDLEHYPDWWPQVRAVASLGPDDALVVCRSTIPYDLELHLTARSRDPEILEVDIDGPIRGHAIWRLEPDPADPTATKLFFHQEVVAISPLLRLSSYVARPALVWNHQKMMQGAVQGLAMASHRPPV